MEFSAKTSELSNAVSILSHIITPRGAKQEYSYIALYAQGDEACFQATDGIIFMKATIPAYVTESGSCALDGKMLTDVVRKQPGFDTVIKTDGQRASIRSNLAKTQLSLKPLEDFPDEPELKNDKGQKRSVMLPAALLASCISGVEYATSSDALRPVLCGILLEVGEGYFRTVAVDGYRLAIREGECSHTGGTVAIIIPGQSAGEIVSLLSAEKNEEVEIESDGERMRIRSANIVFNSMLTAGTFIDYQRTIPENSAVLARVSCKELREAVDRSMIVGRAGKRVISLRFDDGGIEVYTRADTGETNEIINCDVIGAPIKISFDGAYLLDALRQSGDSDLEIGLGTPVSPAVFRETGNKKLVNILLPVRTFD